MGKYESSLKFNNYIINNINFRRNIKFQQKEEMPINVSIKSNIKENDTRMEVNLEVRIFEQAEEKNYPFEMLIDITGFFAITNNNEKIDYKPNAVAILYPYVRAIVSTYTANANVPPLILPPINVNKLLNKE